MAGDSYYRSRNRTLLLAALAFVISAVSLTYFRLVPISLSMSSPTGPGPHDIDDDAIGIEKSNHDSGGAKRTYPQVSTLPASLLPTNTSTPRRLIIIGDVHGHLKSVEALLHKVEFSASQGDTVVFAGDLVNKGPDSAGVVALAMRIGAFGVRGNHEERVQQAWEYLEAKERERGKRGVDDDSDSGDDGTEGEITTHAKDAGGEESDGAQNSISEKELGREEEEQGKDDDDDDSSQSTSHEKKHKKKKGKKRKGKDKDKKKKQKGHKHKPHHKDLVTAKSLKPEQRDWLSRLPLILRIGDLGPRYGELLVVHAGLVPGIPLEAQDPEAVMTMRTILLPSSYGASDDLPDLDASYYTHTENNNKNNNNNNQTPLTTTTTTDETQDEPSTDISDEATHRGRKHHPGKMIPSASRKGIPWAEIWTSYQQSPVSAPLPLPASSPSRRRDDPIRPATVVYGHDAKAGLQMRRYAFGIDTGCGNGDTLTAVIFELRGRRKDSYGETAGRKEEEEEREREDEGNERDAEEESDVESRGHKTRIRHRLVSVSCADKH
ncbi:Metallo-dependent phosphatase [Xylaria cf. heliscus]|nr:Metallo-dependent phosphatase [Xylaria cf. heliscus]